MNKSKLQKGKEIVQIWIYKTDRKKINRWGVQREMTHAEIISSLIK